MDRASSPQRVVIARCDSYDEQAVYEAVRKGIDLLGGISAFVAPGQRVLLKANILRPSKPAAAITTHPAVLSAVARIVIEAGGVAVIGDSPGGPLRKGLLKATYVITGIEEAAKRSGAQLNYDTEALQVPNPDGKLIKLFDVLRAVVEADVLINMPKLKTHTLMHFTGAVKNLFGTVPGMMKTGYHGKLQRPGTFAQMLVDLSSVVKPSLVIMDAVIGMEGNGPSMGTPRQIGAILFGTDNTAVDLVATALVGIPPQDVPTIVEARERGLFAGGINDLTLIGESLNDLLVAGFKVPDTGKKGMFNWPGNLRPYLTKQLVWNPVPQKGICNGCGTCALNCPVEAIKIGGRLAAVNYNDCIRCYCCHELCPEGAIELKRSALANLAGKLHLA